MGIWERVSRRLGELSEELLPDDLRDRVDEARRFLEEGQPRTAKAALEGVLAHKPDYASALHLLGICHLELDDPKSAATVLEAAVLRRAGFGEALALLGEARLALGDIMKAQRAFRDALDHGGGDGALLAEAYRGLGRCYLASEQRDKAVRELRKALAEDPSDAQAACLLGEALLANEDMDPQEVRKPILRLSRSAEAVPEVLLVLGRLELHAGRLDVAEEALCRAITKALSSSARIAALTALAELSTRKGDATSAHRYLMQALELAPGKVELHVKLGSVHRMVKNTEAALAAYEQALTLSANGDSDSMAWARRARELALTTAWEADDLDRARIHAAAILAQHPEHGLALAVKGAAYVATGENSAARACLDRTQDSADARVVLCELELAQGNRADALAHVRAALKLVPNGLHARRALVAARLMELGHGVPSSDPYVWARRVLLATRTIPELGDLAAQAAQAVESHDRPLLVTVMGEFSSGKSTFVNAFLGAEVAPVGATPTTAAIHILKYGRTKAGRIIYIDDTIRDIQWEDIATSLRAQSPSEVRRIRQVELLFPSEVLQRVSIVDTPGLNSILPEHETTARGFINEADAIVWLFSAGQAGKASEQSALAEIRAQGKRVLAIVNKIDQLSSDEARKVTERLADELSDCAQGFFPVSARDALAALSRNDDEALIRSGWPLALKALEECFFAKARSIKREACSRRLATLLEEGRGRALSLAEAARMQTERLWQGSRDISVQAHRFATEVVPQEKQRLAAEKARIYRDAAREVAELVRPRTLPFGSNRATEADRDFLIAHLEQGLAEMLAPTQKRVVDAIGAAAQIARAVDADLAQRERESALLVEARVFDRFRAYLRGYLRGGRIDDFFARVLPKLELTEDAIYHALVRDAPDFELELAEPLSRHGHDVIVALAGNVERLAEEADLVRYEVDNVFLAVIERLEEERKAMGAPRGDFDTRWR